MILQGCLPGRREDVWDALTMMDAQPDGRIVLLYSGYVIRPGERDHEFSAGWNREHVFPKSHAALSTKTPGPGTDLHNLHPADVSVNSERGNKEWWDDVGSVDGKDGMKRLCLVSKNAWEPADVAKGTVARALMYMACMYCDKLRLVSGYTENGTMHLGNLPAIQRWAAQFPPTEREQRRNAIAEELQGNRNPFIDDPQLCLAALMTHNSLKQMQANSVLREARAWADSVALTKTAPSSGSLLHQQERYAQQTSSGAHNDAALRCPQKPVPLSAREAREAVHQTSQTSQITSTSKATSRSARGPNIAERHAAPPFWYNCNRAVYGRLPDDLFPHDFLRSVTSLRPIGPCCTMVAAVALPMDCLKGCAQFLRPSVADVLDEDRRQQLWDGVDLTQLSETSLRSLVASGVPSSRRWELWTWTLRVPPALAPLEPTGAEGDAETAKVDALRTSLGGQRLSAAEVESLEKVLRAYASYNPDIGYCQGMNFVVALLLVVSGDESETFRTFISLVDHLELAGFYASDFPKLRESTEKSSELLQKLLPKLFNHLDENGILMEQFLHPWHISLFASSLPRATVLELWDELLTSRRAASKLPRLSVALLELQEAQLLRCNGQQLMKMLKFPLGTDVDERRAKALGVRLRRMWRLWRDLAVTTGDFELVIFF
eukprot:s98_g19.t3